MTIKMNISCSQTQDTKQTLLLVTQLIINTIDTSEGKGRAVCLWNTELLCYMQVCNCIRLEKESLLLKVYKS